MSTLSFFSAAGNTFALIDAFDTRAPHDVERLARETCAERGLDGLLLFARPKSRGDVRMELVNADGSRAETCGNGLRCIAKHAFESGRVRGTSFVIEDDAGAHSAHVELDASNERVVRAEIHMGTPRIVEHDESIALDDVGAIERGDRVDVGNPHFVLFVDDERTADVRGLGARIEHHPAFPRGTNVEFVAFRGGPRPASEAFLRVFERGVGETAACGSGACAASVAAVQRGLARWPLVVHLPGGDLRVRGDGHGGVWLAGPVEELAR